MSDLFRSVREVPRSHRIAFGGEVLVGLCFAVYSVFHFAQPIAAIDEAAHMAYVQWVANEHRLPVLGHDPMTADVASYASGSYPKIVPPPPLDAGLGAHNYEAFQPPLYYVSGAVVYASVPGTFEQKFFALRLFGVVLWVAAVGLVGYLAWLVAPDRWVLVACWGAGVLVLPGTISRFVTVSNSALEPVMTLATAAACVVAVRSRAVRWLAVASLLAGASVLTKLTLSPMVVAVAASAAVVGGRSVKRLTIAAVVAAGCICLVVGPWLLWNRQTYGAATANELAKDMQMFAINPDRADYGWAEARELLENSLGGIAHAQEASPYVRPPFGAIGWTVSVVLLVVPAAAWLGARSSARLTAVLGLPVLGVLVLLTVTSMIEDWPALIPRYLMPVLPAWAIGAGLALDSYRSERSSLAAALLAPFVACALVLIGWSLTTPVW